MGEYEGEIEDIGTVEGQEENIEEVHEISDEEGLEEGSVVGILGEVTLLQSELQLVGAHVCQHGVIGYDAVFC